MLSIGAPMSAVSYTRDFLPDLLWIDSLSYEGAGFNEV